MKRIYLSGQSSFGNRGCEAIVRSTVELLNDCFKDIEVLVPSVDIEKDKKQWPDSINHNVTFVEYYCSQTFKSDYSWLFQSTFR